MGLVWLQCLPIREWTCRNDEILLHGDHFFLSGFSSSEVNYTKIPPFRVNSRLQLADIGRKERRAFCIMSKANSVTQGIYSQYSSPVEALKFDR